MQKKIDENDVGTRLDVYLQGITGLTRSSAQKALENGHALLNGKAAKANYRLRVNDVVEYTAPEAEILDIVAEDIKLDILFEDDDVIVVNKPKGMVVHPAPGHTTGTLVNALMFHCGKSLSGINGIMRPGIVHRIDKDTSGLLVVAKSDRAHTALSEQFANHTVKRQYTAIVHGRPNPANGTIDAALARNKKDRKKMAIDPNGKKAITHYETVETLGMYTLITARLETGRTHQIRLHMAYNGNPVLADPVYSRSKQTFKLDGQALHAQTIGFEHVNGERMEFEAKPPGCFLRALEELRARAF